MALTNADERPLLLVLRPLGLGDLLTGIPALRALARAHPEHRRILVAPRWQRWPAAQAGFCELVPAVPLGPLPSALDGADLAVNLHGRGPASTAVLAATAPRRLLAFDVPGGPWWIEEEHDRARWCRLLEHHGFAADPADFRIEGPTDRAPTFPPGATVIHPGAAAPARRWPIERWIAIARSERTAGRPVLVTGSVAEAPLARTLVEGAGLPVDACLAGTTDLAGLAAVISDAGRLACADTGVAHLASALGVPSVVLFGPVSPDAWGPPPGPHIALWRRRRGDPHGADLDPGLAAITVEDVRAALDELGAATARGCRG